MSVNFRFVKKNGEVSENHVHGCFGTLMGQSVIGRSLANGTRVQHDIRDYNFLEYLHIPMKYLDANNIAGIQKDSAFKLKLFREITNQFPWMKDVIKVRYSDENTSINSNSKAHRYTLIARLDLSKPSDTVWFCLNLFRLITRVGSVQNGGLVKDESFLEKMYKWTGNDAWKTALLMYGFNIQRISNPFTKGIVMSFNVMGCGSTCLTSFSSVPKEEAELFIKDPIHFLNKAIPAIDKSNQRGLLSNLSGDLFTEQYFGNKWKQYDNRPYRYQTLEVMETLFGKDFVDMLLKEGVVIPEISRHDYRIEKYWSK